MRQTGWDRNCTYFSETLPHSTEKCAKIKRWLYDTEDGRMYKHVLHIAMNNNVSGHRYCPTYTTATVPKIRRKSNFEHGGIEHTSGQLYMYVHRRKSSCNPNGNYLKGVEPQQDSNTACAILLPLSWHRSFIPQEKIRHVWKMLIRFCNVLIFFMKLKTTQVLECLL